MEDLQGEQRALADALDRFSRKADEILKSSNSNRAEIHVNAGGVGVWLATTACFVMLAVNVGLALMFSAHDRKIERLEDYLQAIYTQAPHLRESEDGGKAKN